MDDNDGVLSDWKSGECSQAKTTFVLLDGIIAMAIVMQA